jgi:hypothetical protein
VRLEWMVGTVLAFALAGCPEDSAPDDGDDAGGSGGGSDAGASDAGASVDAAGPGGGSGDAGQSDAGAGDPSQKVGTFTIELKPPEPASSGWAPTEGYASIAGKVTDRPVPQEIIWEDDLKEGGCTLVKPRVPFCETPCSSGVCIEDDKCAPNAVNQSVGTVTVSGLKGAGGVADVKMDPVGTDPLARIYSTPGDVSLAYPPFSEGDAIKLQAAGAQSPGFSMTAKGIAPLEVTTTAFPLKSATPLAMAWKAPGQADLARIHVEVDISHHGGVKGKILCDVADSGSLTIAGALATKLLQLGVAGFPTIKLTRRSAASAQTSAGTVELQIVETVERAVQIDGLLSCSGPGDCPSGKSCQADLTCK